MSILIKGVSKPPNCYHCVFCDRGDGWCFALQEQSDYSKCPITEISGHGRLIDADDLIHDAERWIDHPDEYIRRRNKDLIYYLKTAPAVIESEE